MACMMQVLHHTTESVVSIESDVSEWLNNKRSKIKKYPELTILHNIYGWCLKTIQFCEKDPSRRPI